MSFLSTPDHSRRVRWEALFELLLLALILLGAGYRFSRANWSQGANLHPDEYGLTGTLIQLRLPASPAEYFNTRLSPISPYMKYNLAGAKAADGPDNRMRWGQWPIILLKAGAELTGSTGYDEQRLLGRQMSALADVVTLLILLLIGARLYERRAGLLAAALYALAVLPIQQSHFMTVDNFAVLFTALAMYAAVRAAQSPVVERKEFPVDFWPVRAKNQQELNDPYSPRWSALLWYLLFGLFFGMAVACKVNLLPLGGMIAIAALIGIADLKLRSRADLLRILLAAAGFLAAAVVVALLTFRLTQPMSFRAASGDTTLLTLNPNPDWLESMKVAQAESDGVGGGPPGEQWAFRAPVLFPLMNMVLWGLGLPLGLAAWGGWLGALWQWLRYGRGWRAHLLPLVWVGGDFFFLATRWVKSVRYFLPLYPFLCLLAAWGLLALWRWARNRAGPRRPAWSRLAGALMGLTALGTLAWATMFMSAIYWTDHTRLQATHWIYRNIPGPVELSVLPLERPEGQPLRRPEGQPVGLPDQLRLTPGDPPLVASFAALESGALTAISLPHASAEGAPGQLIVTISADREGRQPLAQATLEIPSAAEDSPGDPVQVDLNSGQLQAGNTYYIHLVAQAGVAQPGAAQTGGPVLTLARAVITNESWDEGLPVPFEGFDPFGQLYRGMNMEVRWADSPEKLANLLGNLAQADYVIVPSQRAVWASCRIPRTYPMTMEYYRALFDGRLGFELAADFQAPWRLGPLYVSDLAGSVAWGAPPRLPVFNHNPLAAEEAFSVYDHPPVWIFKKRADFDINRAAAILAAVDLRQVVVQGPREADGPPCQ